MVSQRSKNWSRVKNLASQKGVLRKVTWASSSDAIKRRIAELQGMPNIEEPEKVAYTFKPSKSDIWAELKELRDRVQLTLPRNVTWRSNVQTMNKVITKFKEQEDFDNRKGPRWSITARADIGTSNGRVVKNQRLTFMASSPDKEPKGDISEAWYDEAQYEAFIHDNYRIIAAVRITPDNIKVMRDMVMFGDAMIMPHLGTIKAIVDNRCVYTALKDDFKCSESDISKLLNKPVAEGLTSNDVKTIAEAFKLPIVIVDLQENVIMRNVVDRNDLQNRRDKEPQVYMIGENHMYKVDDRTQQRILADRRDGSCAAISTFNLQTKTIKEKPTPEFVATFKDALATVPSATNYKTEVARVNKVLADGLAAIKAKDATRAVKRVQTAELKEEIALVKVDLREEYRKARADKTKRIIYINVDNLYNDYIAALRNNVSYAADVNFNTHTVTRIKVSPSVIVLANDHYAEYSTTAAELDIEYENQRCLGLAKVVFNRIAADRWTQSELNEGLVKYIPSMGGWNFEKLYNCPDDEAIHGVDLYRNYASAAKITKFVTIPFMAETTDFVEGDVISPNFMYVVFTKQTTLFMGDAAYNYETVKIGLDDGLITVDEIKYKIPVEMAPENDKVINEFIDMCYTISNDKHRKDMVNLSIGQMATSIIDSRTQKSDIIVASLEEANYYYNINKHPKKRIEVIEAEDHGLAKTLYRVSGESKARSLSTDRITRNQIIQTAKIATYNLMKKVRDWIADNGTVVKIMTDCVYYSLKNGVAPMPADNNNMFGSSRTEITNKIEFTTNTGSCRTVADEDRIMGDWNVTVASETEDYKAADLLQHTRCFISGFAGSGKTHIANELIKTLEGQGQKVARMAFTNSASKLLAGGSTFHSALRMSICGSVSESIITQFIENTDAIVIDEVSMVDAKIYKMLAASMPPTMKIYLFGDFRQCRPIESNNNDFKYEDSTMFKTICGFNKVELKKSYRACGEFAADAVEYFENCKGVDEECGSGWREKLRLTNAIDLPEGVNHGPTNGTIKTHICRTNETRKNINVKCIKMHAEEMKAAPVPIDKRLRVWNDNFAAANTVEFINTGKLYNIIKNPDKFSSYFKSTKLTPDELMVMVKKLVANTEPAEKGRFSNPNIRQLRVSHRRRNPMFRGRIYADGSVSMQNMNKKIRAIAADNNYIDIDMVNAHCAIYVHVADKYGLKSTKMIEYVNNREAILKMVMDESGCDRDKAKTTILMLMNGGEMYDGFNSDWLNQFKIEVDEIAGEITTQDRIQFNSYVKYLSTNNKDPERRPEHRYVNHLMCETESRVLTTLITTLNRDKYISDGEYVPCFDGVMVLKTRRLQTAVTNGLLNDISDKIMKQMGLSIQFAVKAMETPVVTARPYKLTKSLERWVEPRRLDEFPYIFPDMKVISEITVKKQFTKNEQRIITAVDDEYVTMGELVLPIDDFKKDWRPAYAVTAHKVQGQSLGEAYQIHEFYDMDRYSRYVALTRTTYARNVTIVSD
jgi:hypothetical protein